MYCMEGLGGYKIAREGHVWWSHMAFQIEVFFPLEERA